MRIFRERLGPLPEDAASRRWLYVPYDQLSDEIGPLAREDARALGCEKEIKGVHDILTRGTSAHRQLKDYELERAAGASTENALKAVVDTLIHDTAEGL